MLELSLRLSSPQPRLLSFPKSTHNKSLLLLESSDLLGHNLALRLGEFSPPLRSCLSSIWADCGLDEIEALFSDVLGERHVSDFSFFDYPLAHQNCGFSL